MCGSGFHPQAALPRHAEPVADDGGTPGEDYDTQLWTVIDPSGELREIIDLATGSPGALPLAAEATSDLRVHAEGYRALIASGGHALRHLPPRGWYPFAMRTEALDEAVRLIVAGKEGERTSCSPTSGTTPRDVS